jgi:hypothetical protein
MAWALDKRRSRLLTQAVAARTEHAFLEREAVRALRRTLIRDDVPDVRVFPRASASGRTMRYPWDDWTDGQWWLCVADVDYMTSRDAFTAGLYAQAASRGMTVVVHRARGCVATRFS